MSSLTVVAAPAVVDRSPLEPLIRSWTRSLRAENKAIRTVETYVAVAHNFAEFLKANDLPQDAIRIERHHVEAFIADRLAKFKPTTASIHYRSLQQFFRWLLTEGEIAESPMANTRPPKLGEVIVPVPKEAEIERLLRVCSGDDFLARRDHALLSVFIDTGCRRAEVTGLRYTPDDPEANDVDLDAGTLRVRGKGNKVRLVAIERKAIRSLDRYLRLRDRHPQAHLPALWLGRRGALTGNGVFQVIKERAQQAGLDLHPHQLRHFFSDRWLSAGGSEESLMRLNGWSSRAMVSRYAATVAGERAREAHKRLSPLDNLR